MWTKRRRAPVRIAPMSARATRLTGMACVVGYAAFIVSIYRQQPQTIAQVTGGVAASVGAYQIDAASFEQGLRFFRDDKFIEARTAFERADPAGRDARTQFYIAYSFYRQGWGRVYHDDELYREGMKAIDNAAALAPGGQLRVDDPDLGLPTLDELRAELSRGSSVDASDFNPLKLFRTRR
jgi:hypothetical protein